MPENISVSSERRVQPSVESYLPPAVSKRVSWSAIFAGAVTVFSLQLVFQLLGVGIGASAVDPLTERNPLSGLGVGAGIWFFAWGLVALFAGGYLSARLAGVPRNLESTLHGFLTWATSALLSVVVAATIMGGVVGGVAEAVGGGLSAAGEAAGGVAQNERLAGEARERIEGAGLADQARQMVQDARNVTPREEEQMRQGAQQAAQGAAAGGFGASIALLIGAVVASLGGRAGRPHDLRLRYTA
jgi:hypothetical protein